MRRARFAVSFPAVGFPIVLLGHACLRFAQSGRSPMGEDLIARWLNFLHHYLLSGDALLGLSYGAAAALALRGLQAVRVNRRAGIAGAIGGASLGGILAVAACFLVGCCGSPMLAVWAGLFGTRVLGGSKLVTALVTLASVAVGWWWMGRCCRGRCCD